MPQAAWGSNRSKALKMLNLRAPRLEHLGAHRVQEAFLSGASRVVGLILSILDTWRYGDTRKLQVVRCKLSPETFMENSRQGSRDRGIKGSRLVGIGAGWCGMVGSE